MVGRVESVSSQAQDLDSARQAAREMALAKAVATVEASLDVTGEPVAQPVLVLLCGLPGSGKSYLARLLRPHLSATIVETDHVRRILFAQPRHTGPESAWVYAVCHALIAHLLAGSRSVIFDATNLIEHNREHLYRLADRAQAKLVVVRTVAPENVIRQRLAGRSQRPDPWDHSDADVAVYEKMRPSEEPIRRPHLAIDTTQDIQQAVRRILRECRM